MNSTSKPKWLIPVLIAVAALVLVVVVVLVATRGSSSQGPKGQLGVKVTKTEGLDSKFSIFATLASKKGKIIWTKRVYSDKPFVVGNLPKDADRIALTASPCSPSKTSSPKGKKGAHQVVMGNDCNVFHGGMTLGNYPLRTSTNGSKKAPSHLEITAHCKMTKEAAGLSCDGSEVKVK
jgi:hypothetical protein